MYHTSLISSSALFIFSFLVIMLHTFEQPCLSMCVCACTFVCKCVTRNAEGGHSYNVFDAMYIRLITQVSMKYDEIFHK